MPFFPIDPMMQTVESLPVDYLPVGRGWTSLKNKTKEIIIRYCRESNATCCHWIVLYYDRRWNHWSFSAFLGYRYSFDIYRGCSYTTSTLQFHAVISGWTSDYRDHLEQYRKLVVWSWLGKCYYFGNMIQSNIIRIVFFGGYHFLFPRTSCLRSLQGQGCSHIFIKWSPAS